MHVLLVLKYTWITPTITQVLKCTHSFCYNKPLVLKCTYLVLKYTHTNESSVLKCTYFFFVLFCLSTISTSFGIKMHVDNLSLSFYIHFYKINYLYIYIKKVWKTFLTITRFSNILIKVV